MKLELNTVYRVIDGDPNNTTNTTKVLAPGLQVKGGSVQMWTDLSQETKPELPENEADKPAAIANLFVKDEIIGKDEGETVALIIGHRWLVFTLVEGDPQIHEDGIVSRWGRPAVS